MLWARPGENLGFFPRLTKFVKQPGKITNDQVTKTTIIKIACLLRMNLEINFHGKGSFTIIQKDPLITSFNISYLDLIIKLYIYESSLRQEIIKFVSYA